MNINDTFVHCAPFSFRNVVCTSQWFSIRAHEASGLVRETSDGYLGIKPLVTNAIQYLLRSVRLR